MCITLTHKLGILGHVSNQDPYISFFIIVGRNGMLFNWYRNLYWHLLKKYLPQIPDLIFLYYETFYGKEKLNLEVLDWKIL